MSAFAVSATLTNLKGNFKFLRATSVESKAALNLGVLVRS